MKARSGSEAPRYRVILVSVPEEHRAEVVLALPRSRHLRSDELPLIVRVTHDAAAADDTAWRLRQAGAGVVVDMEWGSESLHCRTHPAHVQVGACERCGEPICSRCQLDAEGLALCSEHRDEHEDRTTRTRTRQLFAVLLFALFIYQVVGHLQRERAVVESGRPIHVGVIQFAPPGARENPLVRGLNSWNEGHPTLRDIKQWYDEEFARYTGVRRDYLLLDVRGPFFGRISPPALASPDDGPFTLLFRSLRYASYWRNLARGFGVDPGSFDARLFVVYSREAGDIASHSRGSEKGRVAVAQVALDEHNPAYVLITLAHELAHTLGATDKYDPDTFLGSYPEGYVEPFVRPLYPQRYSELMAVDIPTGRDSEVEPRSLRQVRIGYRTAAEMSWISKSEADYFYQHDEDDLTGRGLTEPRRGRGKREPSH